MKQTIKKLMDQEKDLEKKQKRNVAFRKRHLEKEMSSLTVLRMGR